MHETRKQKPLEFHLKTPFAANTGSNHVKNCTEFLVLRFDDDKHAFLATTEKAHTFLRPPSPGNFILTPVRARRNC
ncbi:hypothetical protein L1987_04394 [Smallanthus sonchifolius]|uniref:Uncharacterized protein n=1 Tax=Smallanthus sonchifolius TaxID=185202 RepID=A0ACB9KDC2_9ASTR|nr:hypothetical protein L1987_04394 [Smallanthus sonchifolius]